MNDKEFYDRIIESDLLFDKVIFELENMSQTAPNTRSRWIATQTIQHLQTVREVCKKYKDAAEKQ